MAEHVFDIPTFRQLYPAFSNATVFPDAYLNAQWTAAGVYLGKYDGPLLAGDELQLALNLMTAHLTQTNVIITGGGETPNVGVLQSATVDKVSVSMTPPPVSSGWRYWLASTPYGLQLWALLSRASAGGLYIGGSTERRGYRKAGGRF
jgi:hypothetical protein